jgi:hypothetical protein
MRSYKSFLVLCIVLASSLTAFSQQQAMPSAADEARIKLTADTIAVMKEQFGPSFTLATTPSQAGNRYLTPTKEELEWTFFVNGDLDNDGIQDAVIVARGKSPMGDQGAFNYKVIDPFYAAHGYGNPEVTAGFQTEDPRYANNVLLVIHGAGADAWRSKTPKAKYVIINLQFSNVLMGNHLLNKKKMKSINAIQLAEENMVTQTIYWDGKKYRWASVGTQTELP